MTVLPQLRAEVVAAVAAPRRRRRVPLTPVFALAAVAVTVAIVVLALPGEPPDAPTPVAGTPPASQLARFGVLRRAPTPADREALRTLYAQLAPADIPDLREDYVRAVGPDLILYSLPYANRLWDAVNGGVRSDPLCIYATTGGLGCWTSEQLAAGVSFTAGDRRIGLVPDGVASVTLRLEDGSDHSAPVRDNVYELEVPMPKGVAPDVRGVTWRKADGEFAGP